MKVWNISSTFVEGTNITRQVEKSFLVCWMPLAKGNLELPAPSVSSPHALNVSTPVQLQPQSWAPSLQPGRSRHRRVHPAWWASQVLCLQHVFNFIQKVQCWKKNHRDLKTIHCCINGGKEIHYIKANLEQSEDGFHVPWASFLQSQRGEIQSDLRSGGSMTRVKFDLQLG